MKKLSFVFISSAIIMTALIFNNQPAAAITISQINLEIVARPGETIDQLVQIYDESYAGSTVYPVVYNFTESPSAEGAVLVLTDPADLKPDRNWIQWRGDKIYGVGAEDLSEDEELAEDAEWGQVEVPIILPAEGTLADFPYRIVVPEDAEPGTHLISLIYQLKPSQETTEEGAAVFVGSNVTTNIFLKVLGNTMDNLEVDFRSGYFTNRDANLAPAEREKYFEPKKFFLKPPVDFMLTINNTGNTHQKPGGNIKIVNDLFGGTPEILTINADNRIILPSTERTFEVNSFGQGFMFGKFRAKIEILYGDPLKPFEKEIDFWIVPLVEILIVLGIIILITVIIIIIRKSRKKKGIKREIEKDAKIRQQIMEEMKKQLPQAPPTEKVLPQPQPQPQPKPKPQKKKTNNNKKLKK